MTTYILHKNRKTKFQENLPTFLEQSSITCAEIFSESSRPAKQLEASNSRLFKEVK